MKHLVRLLVGGLLLAAIVGVALGASRGDEWARGHPEIGVVVASIICGGAALAIAYGFGAWIIAAYEDDKREREHLR